MNCVQRGVSQWKVQERHIVNGDATKGPVYSVPVSCHDLPLVKTPFPELSLYFWVLKLLSWAYMLSCYEIKHEAQLKNREKSDGVICCNVSKHKGIIELLYTMLIG